MDLEKGLVIFVVGAMLTVPLTAAHGVVENPVVNPGFEIDQPDVKPLEGSPADECIGVGHQLFYGSHTPQAKVENATVAVLAPEDRKAEGEEAAAAAQEGDADATLENATQAAQEGNRTAAEENVTRLVDSHDSPKELEEEALFQAGYGHCVFSDENGTDIAWLNPVRLATDDATHWSGHNDDTLGDLDDDGDREIAIPTDPETPHNLWQAWPSPFQAFTARFQALELDVEAGAIPDGALIQVSLSATPVETQSGDLVLFRDCALNFPGTLLNDHLDAQGHVDVNPLEAGFSDTGDPDCEELEDRWNDPDTTDHQRREILGRLRVVQLSFWRFHVSPEDPSCACSIQLDNVALSHATTVAEEVADGNVRADPDPTLDG